jgi:hypothetical protein
MDFTVGACLYGDYPELHKRLLDSLDRPQWQDKFVLRLGLNNVPDETNRVIPLGTSCFHGQPPHYKYPLMRVIVHGGDNIGPIDTPYFMWFDDDSWITNNAPKNWFEIVAQLMRQCDMLGKIYFMNLRGNQHQWVEDQPWYNNIAVKPKQKMNFITGGWWCIKTEILKKWDWPPAGDWHNGGDVMLGALCQQQGYKMKNFEQHVAINANDSGKASTATRRGTSTVPLGADYDREAVITPAGDWQALL